MTSASPSTDTFNVVIAGGGVAALETALALRELGEAHLSTTLVAPNAEFVYRPMTVREPFAYSAAQRYPLGEIAEDIGAELLVDSFAWVDAAERIAHTEAGTELHYDALVLALGARAFPRYKHALTIDDRRLDELLHGLIQDVEAGYVKQLAFVIPKRMAWPLPIYELALMTAGRAHDMGVELKVTIATPETKPLAIFGDGASTGVSQLLDDSGITVVTSADCEIPATGQITFRNGTRRLQADRIVALPELYGPAVRGLPAGSHGFIPVDPHCQVRHTERVYAAGDATDFAVKHGGISAQQADTAAQSIAALAGGEISPEPFHPTIRGILLTGGKPRYLSAHVTGGHGFASHITDTPTWSPPTKIAARYLAPYLDARDR